MVPTIKIFCRYKNGLQLYIEISLLTGAIESEKMFYNMNL